jgi:DNA invertase Pin-like site-specific DNA recombinase
MTTYTLGYARVSTDPQSLDQQFDALIAAGLDEARIYSDKMSGSRSDRPGLESLLGAAREGDTIVVVALDRLGRSMAHVIQTVQLLQERGIVLRSLRENIDFSTPTGRMMDGIFACLAEYERELIKERAAAARKAAAARGRQSGRPPVLDTSQVQLARRMLTAGESVSEIARALSVSRATIYRATSVTDNSLDTTIA